MLYTHFLYVYARAALCSPTLIYQIYGGRYSYTYTIASSPLDLFKPQIFVKSFAVWFSSKKIDQTFHFILTSTLLEDRVSVSSSLFAVHGIFLEYRVKHVCAVDLGRQIPIIPGLVDYSQYLICNVVGWLT